METISGPVVNDLGNRVSDAINRALRQGMRVDDAVCVASTVAADYARATYGNDYLEKLALVVKNAANLPLPENAP